MTHAAPPIQLEIKRSDSLSRILLLFLTLDVCILLAAYFTGWLSMQALAGITIIYLGIFVWALKSIQDFHYGILNWDGKVWHLLHKNELKIGAQEKQVLEEVHALQVSLDLQIYILLSARVNAATKHWLWLDRSDFSHSDWIALRRALYTSFT